MLGLLHFYKPLFHFLAVFVWKQSCYTILKQLVSTNWAEITSYTVVCDLYTFILHAWLAVLRHSKSFFLMHSSYNMGFTWKGSLGRLRIRACSKIFFFRTSVKNLVEHVLRYIPSQKCIPTSGWEVKFVEVWCICDRRLACISIDE